MNDPRPDLPGGPVWALVLAIAKKRGPEVFGLLHGLRIGGAALAVPPAGMLRLDYRPAIADGQSEADFRALWLEPARAELAAVFAEAAERLRGGVGR